MHHTHRVLARSALLSVAILYTNACYSWQTVDQPAARVLAPNPGPDQDEALRLDLRDGPSITVYGARYRDGHIVGYRTPLEAANGQPGNESVVLPQDRVRGPLTPRSHTVYVSLRDGRRIPVYLPVQEERRAGGKLRWLYPSETVPFQWIATDVEPAHGFALADVTQIETEQVDAMRSVRAGGALVGGIVGIAFTAMLVSALVELHNCDDFFSC